MIPQNKALILFVMILFFLSGCIYSSNMPPLAVKEPSEKLICIKNINVFTGDADQEIIENVDVLIKDGRIERIGKFSMPETDCRIIDVTGKMAIPGLIDHHIHINAPGSPPWFSVLPNRNLVDRNLSAFLYAGITTVFDMGGPAEDLKETKERIEADETLNPRFFYAGKVLTAKGGHPDWIVRELVPWPVDAFLMEQIAFLVESRKDIAPAIALNKAMGSSLTKIMVDQIPLGIPSLYEPLVADIVKESDRSGLIVGSHIGSESEI